jgi:hypothetical protein
MRALSVQLSLALGSLLFVLPVLLAGCDYDLSEIPRKDDRLAPPQPSTQGDDDGGADEDAGPADAGAGADLGPPPCDADALRCQGSEVQRCDDGAWVDDHACGEASCNSVTFDCNACNAGVTADGVLACARGRAEASGSAVFELDTEPLTDADQGKCGGKGSPEGVVEWNAPETDYWHFDTLGSSYDTVLYARDCACDGPELGCNDDAGGSESELVLHVERGQRIACVIDGPAGDKGRAVLNAERVTCPSFELDPASLPSTFTDRGGDGSEAFRYQAPAAGLYSFRVTREGGLPAGACVHDGPRCEDPVLGCNDSADGYGAEVIRELRADQVVSLVVTLGGELSGELDFTLDVHALAGSSCTTAPLRDLQDGKGTLVRASAGDLLTPSCAPAGDVRVESDGKAIGFSELRYSFAYEPPEICNVYVLSAFPATVYLLRDGCSGPEVACAVSQPMDTSDPMLPNRSELDVPVTDDARNYLLAIESRDNLASTGAFTVSLGCIQ